MRKIHCISGLGADERIFRNLSIPGVELVYVPWAPVSRRDSISAYAQKMRALIGEERPTIIGLSFGGMIAVEIARQSPVNKIFLISGAKTKEELVHGAGPVVSFLVKNGLIPARLFTIPNFLLFHRFGARTKEEKKLLAGILKATDPRFVKWALKALMLWDNERYTEQIIHIHGTADEIILPINIKPDFWIEGGTHMMVYNRAEEISNIITANL